jgi:hypothetical protein
MPRVNTVKKSRKDQGSCGKCGDPLPKGSPYRFWKFRYGGKRKRCMKDECSPRRSDLTQSKMAAVYDAQDDAEETLASWDREDVSVLRGALESLAETVREVGEEYAEAAEPFGNSGENQERADELESWADSLESAASELEEYEDQDCDTCDGEGVEDCEACDGNGTTDEDCEDCGGNGTIPCSICGGGDAVPAGEEYNEYEDEPCEGEGADDVDDADDEGKHDWSDSFEACCRKGCDYTREPDGFCNTCRDGSSTAASGEEECGNEDCDGGTIETDCEDCDRDVADGGKVPCSNEDCEDGKVKRTDEWADERESEFSEVVGECPL